MLRASCPTGLMNQQFPPPLPPQELPPKPVNLPYNDDRFDPLAFLSFKSEDAPKSIAMTMENWTSTTSTSVSSPTATLGLR